MTYTRKLRCGCVLSLEVAGVGCTRPQWRPCPLHKHAADLHAACCAVVNNWCEGNLAAAANLCSAAIDKIREETKGGA